MKRLLSSFLTMLLCLFSLIPSPVLAAESYSLTFNIKAGGNRVSGVPVELYYIASGDPESYQITDDFLAFAPDLDDLDLDKAAQVEATVKKLNSYIEDFDVEPTTFANTNENGQAIFSSLEQGLYFALGSTFTVNQADYTTESLVFWLEEDTVASPKSIDVEDLPNEPEGNNPSNPNNPGTNNPGSGSDIENGGKDPETGTNVNKPTPSLPGSSSGTSNNTGSGMDIGSSTNDPLFSAPVNTGNETNLWLYVGLATGAAIILGLIFLKTRKQKKA